MAPGCVAVRVDSLETSDSALAVAPRSLFRERIVPGTQWRGQLLLLKQVMLVN
jgi:hypothetical protein